MNTFFRQRLELLLALTIVIVLFISCGKDEKSGGRTAETAPGAEVSGQPQPTPNPFAQPGVGQETGRDTGQHDTGQHDAARNEAPEDDHLPDLSGLSGIEKEIFQRTVAIYGPFHDSMVKWADSADRITRGENAAKALRTYLDSQEKFAKDMDALDREMSPKLDPDFVPSDAFNNAVSEYLSGQNITRKRDRIIGAYSSLLRRFKDDPACKSVLDEIQRIAAQDAQQGRQP